MFTDVHACVGITTAHSSTPLTKLVQLATDIIYLEKSFFNMPQSILEVRFCKCKCLVSLAHYSASVIIRRPQNP